MSVLDSQNITRNSNKKKVLLILAPLLLIGGLFFMSRGDSKDKDENESRVIKKEILEKENIKVATTYNYLNTLKMSISNLENRPDLKTIEGEVGKKSLGLARDIQDLGVDPNEVWKLTQAMKKGGYDFGSTRPGNKFILKLDSKNKIWEFYLYSSNLTFYYTFKDGEELKTSKVSQELKEEEFVLSGVITNSIYNSVIDKGEHPNIVIDLADRVFKGGSIDFFTDCQKGDKYVIIASKKYYTNIRGEKVYTRFYGDIKAAVYKGATVGTLYAFMQNSYEYYDEKGKAMKRPFLKYPFTFKVGISSGFGKRRDPVTRAFTRNHNGTDFPVRVGTPFIATAKGRIVRKAYQKNGAGKYIRIRHSNGYFTEYFHLSYIDPKLTVGSIVKQGQVLGRTGNTGRSTGAHLHYGMKKGNTYINPMRQKFAIEAKAIPKKEKDTFISKMKPLKLRLDNYLEKL